MLAAALVLALSILSAFPARADGQAESIDAQIDQALAPITTAVADVVFWGPELSEAQVSLVVVWLIAAGVFFTVYMGFINLRGFGQALRVVSGRYDDPSHPGEVTHFQALSAALSGTVGIGNIAGVAIAISIGGPGATFWMILAGLFGMTTKFVECTLGHKYRRIAADGTVSGGPMYYLSEGLANRGWPKAGRAIAAFAACTVLAGAFGSGALFQTNQSTAQLLYVTEDLTGLGLQGSQWLFGVAIALVVGSVIIGGIRRIAQVTEILVPFMAAIYVGTALAIIFSNASAIPEAFAIILRGAFSPSGIEGGVIGVLVQGIRRASFSNEAGLGSAAIAHAAAKTHEPIAEGLVALLEPFVDTVVICTMTALVIIITGQYANVEGMDGIALTSAAFESVFPAFRFVLAVAVTLFAFSTSITWFYYGQRAFFYLFPESRRADLLLKLAFMATVAVGPGLQLSSVVGFADAMILGMSVPNIIGLYVMAPEVRQMLKSYLARLEAGEIQPTLATATE